MPRKLEDDNSSLFPGKEATVETVNPAIVQTLQVQIQKGWYISAHFIHYKIFFGNNRANIALL